MNRFVMQYADSIICEPSGLSYTDLKSQMTQKIMIVNSNNKKHSEIVEMVDNLPKIQ